MLKNKQPACFVQRSALPWHHQHQFFLHARSKLGECSLAGRAVFSPALVSLVMSRFAKVFVGDG